MIFLRTEHFDYDLTYRELARRLTVEGSGIRGNAAARIWASPFTYRVPLCTAASVSISAASRRASSSVQFRGAVTAVHASI
jgi:hypothetical protein